eukprot:gene12312-biopygen16928
MHRAPGLAGADRTQKVGIRRPKNRYWCPLAPHRGRIWHPGGTPRKSVFSRFWWIFAPGGPPAPPPPRMLWISAPGGRLRTAAAGWAAASPGPRNRQFSSSARVRLRMTGTNSCIHSGFKTNAPGPRGRGRLDAEGGH